MVDPDGGFFQNFLDDGTVFDPGFRQLVSSARLVVNYALAGRFFDREDYRRMARHGLDYIERVHWRAESERYAWTLRDHHPEDMTQQAYGYAFVLLAYAACRKAGVIESNAPLQTTFDRLEHRFWLPEQGLYADEISDTGQLSDYRGQNANMHLCEAMIAAYEATGEPHYLERAKTLARGIAVHQAAKTDGLIWEHYTPGFDIDWDYNKRRPEKPVSALGFPARPPDRMDQTAAHAAPARARRLAPRASP